MPCLLRRSGSAASDLLQMHTVVDQPLTAASFGRVSCRPLGVEPIEFEWTGPNGSAVELDPSRSEAVHAAPGRYRVVAHDAAGHRADVVLDVEPMLLDAIVVRQYATVPASTGLAWDGSVEAIGEGLAPRQGLQFLWSNGAVTEEPMLRDVPAGRYAVVPFVDEADDPSATPPTMMHLCPPGRVEVRGAAVV